MAARVSRPPILDRHIQLEIAAAFWRGKPLDPGQAVPGCRCYLCTGIAPAARELDTSYIVCPLCRGYRELVRQNGMIRYMCMFCGSQSEATWPIENAGTMAESLPIVRKQHRRKPRRMPGKIVSATDIERVRQINIFSVVRMLGLGEPHRAGARWLVHCPLHRDHSPSLSLDPERGLWYCWPCGVGGDGIALLRAVRGSTFVQAVRELIETAA